MAWRSVGAAWEKPDAGGLAQRGSHDHSGPFTYGGYDLKPPTNTDYLFPDTKKAEPFSRTEALIDVGRVEPHPVIFHRHLQVFPDTTERDCRARCVRVFPNVAEQFPDDTKDHDARVVSQLVHLVIGIKMECRAALLCVLLTEALDSRRESIPFLVEIPERPRCSPHAVRVPSTRSAFPLLACSAARNCGRWR